MCYVRSIIREEQQQVWLPMHLPETKVPGRQQLISLQQLQVHQGEIVQVQESEMPAITEPVV